MRRAIGNFQLFRLLVRTGLIGVKIEGECSPSAAIFRDSNESWQKASRFRKSPKSVTADPVKRFDVGDHICYQRHLAADGVLYIVGDLVPPLHGHVRVHFNVDIHEVA